MKMHLLKYLAVGAMAISPMGCEPRPVVDGEPNTTVIEEDVDMVEDDNVDEPGTGVGVNVGGEPGVDVDVDREPNTNP
jgi:hypothetical protein